MRRNIDKLENNKRVKMMRLSAKRLLFPGLNLHARQRYRCLPEHFGSANGSERRVLDAGCGNGMLSYKSYLKGNAVQGISFKEAEVTGCRKLFNEYMGIPESRMRFIYANLYDTEFDEAAFDEVICTEVLEHLRDDAGICRSFWQALKPGGALHITAPNAAHPYNAAFPLDPHERGGHVRAGYTLETYRALLEPIGFTIETVVGLGGPVRQAINWRIKHVQKRYGAASGLPLFAISPPLLAFENKAKERSMPYTIYVKAIKSDGTSNGL